MKNKLKKEKNEKLVLVKHINNFPRNGYLDLEYLGYL